MRRWWRDKTALKSEKENKERDREERKRVSGRGSQKQIIERGSGPEIVQWQQDLHFHQLFQATHFIHLKASKPHSCLQACQLLRLPQTREFVQFSSELVYMSFSSLPTAYAPECESVQARVYIDRQARLRILIFFKSFPTWFYEHNFMKIYTRVHSISTGNLLDYESIKMAANNDCLSYGHTLF